jgi:hypothetical protein
MDEMTMLKDLGRDLVTAGEGLKPQTRQRVLAGTTMPQRSRTSWFAAPALRHPALRFGVPLGAALLVGGLGITALVHPDTAKTDGVQVSMQARQILLAAAQTARADKAGPPPAKSFIYTRTKEVLAHPSYTGEREAWISVDGSRSSIWTPSGSNQLTRVPGCVGGRPRVEDGANGTTPCIVRPGYRQDFPTSVVAAREALHHEDGASARITDDSAFERAGTLLMEGRMPAASRAALFEAVATIPGVEVVPRAATATGAIGVAVAKVSADKAWRDEIIFDPVSHVVIGRRNVSLMQYGKPHAPEVQFSAGVIDTAIVSRVLHRPDGSVRKGPIEQSGS